jgi:hypothetical protein
VVEKQETPDIIKAADLPDFEELLSRLELHMDWGDLISEVTPHLGADAEAAAHDFLINLGITEARDKALWTRVSEHVRQMAQQRAAELVGKRVLEDGRIVDNPNAEWAITETTRENLHDLAEDAIAEGWTVNQLQHKITESEDFSPARALNIARTEKAYAQNRGEHTAAKDVGFTHKEWNMAAEACDECRENEEAGRIGIDDVFPSGDEIPPAHPACRCDALYYESAEDEPETEEE